MATLAVSDSEEVDHALALAREGKAFADAGRVQSAILAFIDALHIWPEAPGILHNLANALLSVGCVEQALEAARRAHRAAPDLIATQANLLTMLLYSPSHEAEIVANAHRQWGSQFPHVERPPIPAGERIRVGYLSSCFRQNPEYFFMEPILRCHDRHRFEIFCYNAATRTDNFTDRLRTLADGWRDLNGWTDEEAAEVVRRDKIHVLADCSGHYAESRLRLLALRPAPVQVSLPTYPVTTGMPMVDYKITDFLSDPPGHTEHLYTEKLARLPGAFLCYSPWPDHPDIGSLPADRNGHVTFGSFNRLDKLNSTVLAVWARILLKLPHARLLVHSTFHGHVEPPEEHCRPMRQFFSEAGVAPERIRFAGARPLREYFEVRNEVDVALDPFPFRGLTTSCDSLWMGTPTVTLAGADHLARSGLTLLHAVGLEDWVAYSYDEYVQIAVSKAGDLAALREIRRGLRDRMLRSALMDSPGYTAALEQAYLRMLQAAR